MYIVFVKNYALVISHSDLFEKISSQIFLTYEFSVQNSNNAFFKYSNGSIRIRPSNLYQMKLSS